MPQENKRQIAIVFLMAVFLITMLRTAWIGDDAAITLRTVLNFLNGYGLTFNIDERVQAYTHPLWFFLISALSSVLGNVFAATYLLAIGISLGAFWLLLARVATSGVSAIVVGLALLLSKAYLDYATSGLENPLSHLLILAAVLVAIRAMETDAFSDLLLFFLSCSLIYLNRPDLLALMAPLALLVALRVGRKQPRALVRAVLLGGVPVLAWTLFSTYYYGFPFPNTAYAKLGTGIALSERLAQGWRYVMHGIERDPLTLVFVAIAVAVGMAGSALGIALATGIVLYMIYVLSIGGDFMEGRFFTAPLLMAAIVVARSTLERTYLAVLGVGVLACGLANAKATLLSGATYNNHVIYDDGIADERGFYYQEFGLLSADHKPINVPVWVARARSTPIVCGGLGYTALRSGPAAHFIDECALADPLLARLPARFDPKWRIGHFSRRLPTNYQESIASGANLLQEPVTHAYYDSLRLITRGSLNDPARLREIVRFNLGHTARPDWDLYRNREVPAATRAVEVEAAQVAKVVDSGEWDEAGNVIFPKTLDVLLPAPRSFNRIDLSVDNNDIYRVEALTAAGWQQLAIVTPTTNQRGVVRHRILLEREIAGASRIRLTALEGDGMYSLGHLLLE
jgi:arabinofuranosyltransferase